MEGYNGTILAYGQRGNRKTFTMYGNDIENEISVCENSKENINFDIKISVMQIYWLNRFKNKRKSNKRNLC